MMKRCEGADERKGESTWREDRVQQRITVREKRERREVSETWRRTVREEKKRHSHLEKSGCGGFWFQEEQMLLLSVKLWL